MSVEIVIPAVISQYSNNLDSVDVDAGTVGECLNHLIEQFPELGDKLFNEDGILYSHYSLFINGELTSRNNLSESASDGDVILLLIPIAGG